MNQPNGHFENVDIETYREQFHPGDHVLVDVRDLSECSKDTKLSR